MMASSVLNGEPLTNAPTSEMRISDYGMSNGSGFPRTTASAQSPFLAHALAGFQNDAEDTDGKGTGLGMISI